jgi:hypothetical protein
MIARRSWVSRCLFVACAVASLQISSASPNADVADGQRDESVNVWQVLPSEPLVPGRSFALFTAAPDQFVAYGRREYGINLKWIPRKQQHDFGAPANFAVSRSSGSDDPIRYGEAVALKEQTGGYIGYKTRRYGINLDFSNQPSFEWEVRGGRIGELVTYTKTGDSAFNISDVVIGLFNRKAGCFVVSGQREYGIDLVWKGPGC